MQLIDFHSLSRSVQERFTSAAAGRIDPKPIAHAPLKRPELILWWGVIAVASGALAFVAARGFGDPTNPAALQGAPELAIEVVCIAAIVLSALRLYVLHLARVALPYQRGLYAFAMSVIDARSDEIRVHPLADATSIDGPEATSAITIAFPEARFAFPFADRVSADGARKELDAAMAESRRLARGSDPRITLLFALDPLQKPRMSAALGPKGSLAARVPVWARYSLVVAPLVGVAFGLLLRDVRDRWSDRRMFARTEESGTVEAFRAYLDRGGRRSDEVKKTLLPRAELHVAQGQGTVEAIDAFIASHPSSAIQDEIVAARRAALLDDLDRAKKTGTLAAFQAFAKRHPDHGLEPELRAAIHALFAPVLESFRAHAPTDPQSRALVERLFAYSEGKAQAGSTDTTVQIRFHMHPSKNLWKSDKMVADHSWFIGEASYPSRYFDTAHAVVREDAAAKVLGKSLGDAFGPAVFTFQEGPRLDDAQDALPEVTVPTLFITHEEEWPNTFDGSISSPRGIWIDVRFSFDAVWRIPGDAAPAAPFHLEQTEALPHAVIDANKQGGTPQDPLEAKIYGAMAAAAFAQLEAKYLATFVPGGEAVASDHSPKAH